MSHHTSEDDDELLHVSARESRRYDSSEEIDDDEDDEPLFTPPIERSVYNKSKRKRRTHVCQMINIGGAMCIREFSTPAGLYKHQQLHTALNLASRSRRNATGAIVNEPIIRRIPIIPDHRNKYVHDELKEPHMPIDIDPDIGINYTDEDEDEDDDNNDDHDNRLVIYNMRFMIYVSVVL